MKRLSLRAALAALLLFSLPLSAAPQVQELNRLVAVVNDTGITLLELEQRLEQTKKRLAGKMEHLPPDDVLRRQLLEQLIMEELQLARAPELNIRVGDEELNATIQEIARNNGLTLEQYRAIMANEGISFAQLREQIREEITISRVRQREVNPRVNISNEELRLYMDSRAAKEGQEVEYHLSHILFAVPDAASPQRLAEIKQKAEDTLAALRQGEDFAALAIRRSDGSQALEGGSLGWRKGGELPSLFADKVLDMHVGEVSGLLRSPSGFHILRLNDKRGEQRHMIQQVKARHILIAPNALLADEDARLRIINLHQRALKGEDFAELARAHSDDPGSANAGGDLGWNDPSIYVRDFQEALTELQPGEISKPFRSPFGWHIIELQGRRDFDNSEAVRESRARQVLFSRKYEEALEEWQRQLRDAAYVEQFLEG